MCSALGPTACIPLFSPITKDWGDMWVIDELVIVGRVWDCERQERQERGAWCVSVPP